MEIKLQKAPTPYLTTDYLVGLFKDYKQPHHKIKHLADKGELLPIKQGLYVLGEPYQRIYSREVLSGMIYGPSAISFEFALSHYGLIPERVKSVTCICFKRNKSFNTPIGKFTYKYIAKDIYPLRMAYHQTELGNYFIASPEKAICDMAYFEKINSIKEARQYLLDDLRIYENEIENLDSAHLAELARYYKRQSVKNIVDALIEIKNEVRG